MNRMLGRISGSLLFLFLCTTFAFAQTGKCTLKVQQINPIPELFGFHLGMSTDDARSTEPIVEIGSANKLGFAETSFSPEFSPKADKTKYAGVRTFSLQFLDGKLYSLWIGYTDQYKWSTEEDFLPKMSAGVGLLPDGWQRKGLGKVEMCDGLQAQFQMIGQGPSLRLTDTAVKAVYDQRRAAAEAAKPDEP